MNWEDLIMLCSNCKKNQATIYYKQNINGTLTENFLCGECADKLNIGKSFFSSALNINPFAGFFGYQQQPQIRKNIEAPKRCTLCGSEFSDIVKSGKMGCAKCYEVFNTEISPTVIHLHGNVTHNGRATGSYKAKNELKNKIIELKKELKTAIDEQNFEKAAALRDEINSYENKNL